MYNLNNDSCLPNTLDLYKLASLSSKFTSDDIHKIIMALNVSKTPGNDKISVRIIKSLHLLFVEIARLWKKSIINPVHKKGFQQFPETVLDSDLQTHVYINHFKLFMKYLLLLIDCNLPADI